LSARQVWQCDAQSGLRTLANSCTLTYIMYLYTHIYITISVHLQTFVLQFQKLFLLYNGGYLQFDIYRLLDSQFLIFKTGFFAVVITKTYKVYVLMDLTVAIGKYIHVTRNINVFFRLFPPKLSTFLHLLLL
jgi:hypothetical protein